MKPVHQFSGHQTADLTEGKIHRFEDGRIVAYFPKTYEKVGTKQRAAVVNGTMDVQFYKILTWDEVELQVKS